MTKGTYKRLFPRGWALRGWDPQNPTGLTTALPVSKDPVTGAPEPVLQGMVVSISEDGTTWDLGVKDDAHGNTVAFANRDATDLDVIDADKLTGLQFAGQYRFATPFFARHLVDSATAQPTGNPIDYKPGTPITFCKADEFVSKWVRDLEGNWVAVTTSAKGYVRPAQAGEQIIAIAQQHPTLAPYAVTAADQINDKSPVGLGIYDGQQSITTAVDSTSERVNSYFLVIDTRLTPVIPVTD